MRETHNFPFFAIILIFKLQRTPILNLQMPSTVSKKNFNGVWGNRLILRGFSFLFFTLACINIFRHIPTIYILYKAKKKKIRAKLYFIVLS